MGGFSGLSYNKTWRYVAFEVGESQKPPVRLDEHVIPLGTAAGFTCIAVIINQQDFTKTANIWVCRICQQGRIPTGLFYFIKPGQTGSLT